MKKFFKSKYVDTLTIFLITIAISLFIFPVRVYAKEKITISEFLIPTSYSGLNGISTGPDGNIWFTEYDGNKIGRITLDGTITEFLVPTNGSYPWDITSGTDGNLWFTIRNKIGRITPSGIITEFPTPTNNSIPAYITSGPDGNIWFTYASPRIIGKITSDGRITEFSSTNLPSQITSGSDGNIWFTATSAREIGRMTPNGIITEFPVPLQPSGITSGPDGNIWFTENIWDDVSQSVLSKIGRITSEGIITEFAIPHSNSGAYDIVSGPDGNLWFTQRYANKIGRITLSGTITEFLVPTNNSDVLGITTGSDGNIWFTENLGNKIGRVNLVDAKEPGPPDRDFSLLSPFNNGVTWTVSSGYYNNSDQSSSGCHIGIGPDHCRNQLFGLDLVPDQQNDMEILAPGDGKIGFKGKLEGGCIGLRIALDNGLNLNICHFATWNVDTGERVLQGKVLGTRSSSHVHLSLDDRHTTGNLCPGSELCYLPIPFDGKYNLEGVSFQPNQNGETVILPYPKCDNRKNINCEFKVGFEQYQGFTGISTNVALP